MDDAGKYTLALYAALSAAHRAGLNLDELVRIAREDMIGDNSLRPSPQHQQVVIETLKTAVKEVLEVKKPR